MRQIAVYMFALTTWAAMPVRAETCDPTLSPQPGAFGYTHRHGETACEGLFVSPVSGPLVEIVSVTRGDFTFNESAQRVAVKLAAAKPVQTQPNNKPSPVHLRAVGIPVNLNYRMDADFTDGRSLDWALVDVVQPKKLKQEQLGIFAFWQSESGTFVYLPVALTSVAAPPATTPSVAITFRSLGEASDPKWRFIPKGHVAESDTFENMAQSGNRLKVQLDVPLGTLGVIEVTWHDRNGLPRSRRFDLAV